MKIGEVIGRVTLSRVHPSLTGVRWIVVAPCSLKALADAGDRAGVQGAVRGDGEELIVADGVGPGRGQLVGYSEGGEAAMPYIPLKMPVDGYAGVLLDSLKVISHEFS